MGRESVSGQIGHSPKLAEKFRMTKKHFALHRFIYVIVVTSVLFGASGLHAEEKLPMSESFTATTKDFLSDPARTGSLVGSIIAGAAIANPLAPLLGSVAGFIIGKRSDYSDKDSNAARRQAYANRSFIPDGSTDGTEAPSLAGLAGGSGEPPLAAATETLLLGAPKGTDTGEQSLPVPAGDQVVIVKLPEKTGQGMVNQRKQASQIVRTDMSDTDIRTDARIALQKQLAYACNNMQRTQTASPSCYYYSR